MAPRHTHTGVNTTRHVVQRPAVCSESHLQVCKFQLKVDYAGSCCRCCVGNRAADLHSAADSTQALLWLGFHQQHSPGVHAHQVREAAFLCWRCSSTAHSRGVPASHCGQTR